MSEILGMDLCRGCGHMDGTPTNCPACIAVQKETEEDQILQIDSSMSEGEENDSEASDVVSKDL